MLTSLSDIDFSKVYVYAAFDPLFYQTDDIKGIEKLVHATFAEKYVDFKPTRLTAPSDWETFVRNELLSSGEPIFYSGNHDHIYINPDDQILSKNIAEMIGDQRNGINSSVVYSHWPEFIAFRHRAKQHNGFFAHGLKYWTRDTHSVRILTPGTIESWFCNRSDVNPDAVIKRSEDLLTCPQPFVSITPSRELSRHYDAYAHVGISIKNCSPLKIPEGLFGDGIRFAFINSNDYRLVEHARRQGYVVISPFFPGTSAINPRYPDFLWTPEDIPRHLVNRTSQLDVIGDKFDAHQKIEARDSTTLEMIRSLQPLPRGYVSEYFPGTLRRRYGLDADTTFRISTPRRGETVFSLKTIVPTKRPSILCAVDISEIATPTSIELLSRLSQVDSYFYPIVVVLQHRRDLSHGLPFLESQIFLKNIESGGVIYYGYELFPNYLTFLKYIFDITDLETISCVSFSAIGMFSKLGAKYTTLPFSRGFNSVAMSDGVSDGSFVAISRGLVESAHNNSGVAMDFYEVKSHCDGLTHIDTALTISLRR